jgi:hypothetical protein
VTVNCVPLASSVPPVTVSVASHVPLRVMNGLESVISFPQLHTTKSSIETARKRVRMPSLEQAY